MIVAVSPETVPAVLKLNACDGCGRNLLWITDEADMNNFFIVFPKTVEESLKLLEPVLTRREQTLIANTEESRLPELIPIFGRYIASEFRLPGNDPLVRSCRKVSEAEKLTSGDPVYVILWSLWKKLNASSKILKIIK
jgi:hypothetical protein